MELTLGGRGVGVDRMGDDPDRCGRREFPSGQIGISKAVNNRNYVRVIRGGATIGH